MTYLIVWGESAHAVRAGSGGERAAAREAFGDYQPKRMTLMQVNRSTMQSDCKRTRFIAQILLPEHARRMDALGEQRSVDRANQEIQAIAKQWQAEWDKHDRKYGRI